MTSSLLEVLDTAVKIGLGAAISGLATHLHARWANRREEGRERYDRRVQSLEFIAEHVEDFTHDALMYWALITDWGARTSKSESVPPEKLLQIEESKKSLFVGFKHITVSEARLLLLGELKAQKLIREYGDTVVKLAKKAWVGGPPLSRADADTCRQDILNARSLFFTEMSRLYTNK